jgi:hypothetical protein
LASQINASNSGFGGIVSTGDSSGVLQLQTTGTTAVTIDTSQNVGIGTTIPSSFAKLAIAGTTGANVFQILTAGNTSGLYMTPSDGGQFALNSYGSGLTINSTTSTGVVTVGTQSTERMRIDSNGNAAFSNGIRETVYAVVDAAGVAISPNNGTIQTWTLGASRTPTAGTWNAGESMTLMINDGTAYTVTWTTLAVTWVAGTAPTLATTGFTVIEFWKVGSTIYGALVGNVA